MSLINDALKRAKAAQKSDPPSGGPPLEFRPVEPGQGPPKQPLWFFVAGVVAVIVIATIAWKVFSKNEQPPLKVEAKGVLAPTNSDSGPASASAPAGKGPIPPPEPKPTTYQPRTQAIAGAISVAATEPSAPAPPKLQGIVFHPTRPSAVISGKTVFVGDKAGDFRVIAIKRDSVTLVSATATNVLTFEP